MPLKSLIVIGSGPGGYAASLEAAARGLSVTLIDAQETGGTCLNRGCIPSKFFLSRAKHGIELTAPILQLVEQKNAVLATVRQRMDQAAKTSQVRRFGYIIGKSPAVARLKSEFFSGFQNDGRVIHFLFFGFDGP
jgi:pyruvate/2-oxoglutarate dehydrogenase complex dihydrolipoamide dehydrogenase (E3) component